MPLLLTLLAVIVAAFALFWGLSLFAQGYLYNQPANALPLRAGVAAVLLGLFVTGWVYVNTRADGENRYGAIHQFSPTETSPPVQKFEATHTFPPGRTPATAVVKYERALTPAGPRYQSVPDKLPLKITSSDHMITAIEIKDDNAPPVKYDAVLEKGAFTPEKYRFKEVGGGRTIEMNNPQNPDEAVTMTLPSDGVVFLALLLNGLHLVVWVVAFWPVMRFALWHGVGLAVAFCLATTILIMPLLFQVNAVPKQPVPAVQKP